jgi:uncharacterized protein YbaR (Trm112 family)
MIKTELIEILACPACRGSVREENEKILCISCGRKYPVRNGIPVMLVSEAELAKQSKD